jgi:hypothetical protein
MASPGRPGFSQAEAERAYNQVVPLGIRPCRDWFGLSSLEFTPRDGSPLRIATGAPHAAPTVRLVIYYLMCPIVLGRHRLADRGIEFWNVLSLGRAGTPTPFAI